jgi:membrane-associated HD superfamily phosphohydrolase
MSPLVKTAAYAVGAAAVTFVGLTYLTEKDSRSRGTDLRIKASLVAAVTVAIFSKIPSSLQKYFLVGYALGAAYGYLATSEHVALKVTVTNCMVNGLIGGVLGSVAPPATLFTVYCAKESPSFAMDKAKSLWGSVTHQRLVGYNFGISQSGIQFMPIFRDSRYLEKIS